MGLALAALAAMLIPGSLASSSVAAEATPAAGPKIVSTNPDDKTPSATNGEVRALAEVGNRIIVGGTFTTIRNASSTVDVARAYLFAYNKSTGAIDPIFLPVLDGVVDTLQTAPDGASVFVGGTFKNVNGVARPWLVRLDAATGAIITTFDARLSGRVSDLALVDQTLYAIGYFGKSRNLTLQGLGAFNATTGAADPTLVLPLATTRTGFGVRTIDVTDDQDHIVIGGNFTTVGGVARDQIALIDASGASAQVQTNWNTEWLEFDNRGHTAGGITTYIRDIDLSDDGSYFVVATTFYYPGNGDSLSRWEVADNGTDVQPTWAHFTGTDTFTKLTISADDVVYFGGHFRWYNAFRTGPVAGSVSLFGLGAVDAANGMLYDWAPTRERGYGVLAMLITASGDLVIGHDTKTVGGESHPRLAMFPLSTGRTTREFVSPTLPLDLTSIRAGQTTRGSFDGTDLTGVTSASLPPGTVSGFALGDRLLALTGSGLGTYESNGAGSWTLEERLEAYDLSSPSVTGIAYDGNQLFYLRAGDANLHARDISADNLTISPIDRVVSGPNTGDGNSYAGCNGIFVAAGSLYSACNGTLLGAEIATLGVAGHLATPVSGTGVNAVDWTGTIVAAGAPTGTPRVNAALGKATTQSSTYLDLVSSRAVDGNRNGNHGMASSITHTAEGANGWWEVDLGSTQPISAVRVWNRTDCCQERLSNYWVYLSNTPFTSNSPSATRAQAGVTWVRYNGISPRSIEFPFARSARYVRIQAPGGESASGRYLSLAEVEVYN